MTKAQHAYTAHKVCGPRLQSFSIRLVRLQEISWMGVDEAPPYAEADSNDEMPGGAAGTTPKASPMVPTGVLEKLRPRPPTMSA